MDEFSDIQDSSDRAPENSARVRHAAPGIMGMSRKCALGTVAVAYCVLTPTAATLVTSVLVAVLYDGGLRRLMREQRGAELLWIMTQLSFVASIYTFAALSDPSWHGFVTVSTTVSVVGATILALVWGSLWWARVPAVRRATQQWRRVQ